MFLIVRCINSLVWYSNLLLISCELLPLLNSGLARALVTTFLKKVVPIFLSCMVHRLFHQLQTSSAFLNNYHCP